MSKSPYDELQPMESKAPPPPKERGCFFYGCIISLILLVILLIAIGVITWLTIRAISGYVQEYTEPTARALPKFELSDEQRKDLDQRIAVFKDAVQKADQPADTLVLTGDEINAWLSETKELRDKVHVSIEGDKMSGEVSIPLSDLPLPGANGRFLNGKATIKLSMQNGVLIATVDQVEVKGKPLPEQFMTMLRKENLAKSIYDDPERAAFLRKFETIEVTDGKLIMKTRSAETPDAEPKQENAAKDKESDAKPSDEAKPADDSKPPPAEPAKETEKPPPAEPAKDAEQPAEKPKEPGR